MKRWTRIAISLVVGVVIAFSLWILISSERASDAAKQEPLASADASSRNEVAYPPPFPYPSGSVASGPVTDEIDLCGYGRVSISRLPVDMETEADAAMLRVAEALERSAEDRQRTLGLAVRVMLAVDAAGQRVSEGDPLKCLESNECMQRQAVETRRAAAASTDAIARAAAITRDPQTYATALRACQWLGPNSAATSCSGLRPAQWAELDPNNAAAWLEVARDAENRKDQAALDNALLRAAKSRSFEARTTPYGDVLSQLDVRYEPVRTLVLEKLSGAYFSQPLTPYLTVSNYCSKERVADSSRRSTCSDLARMLTEHDSNLSGLTIGASIGERVGWPDEQVAQLRAEHKTLNAEILALTRGDTMSCEWSARIEPWLLGVMKQGEAGYLRQQAEKRRS